jgi:anti-sigma regulatory factor (Ser/Thr protein kinase)
LLPLGVLFARRPLKLGYGPTEITRIVTAASELARNIFKYAGQGTMQWSSIEQNGRIGMDLVFVDCGPGIQDLSLAMHEGIRRVEALVWPCPEQNVCSMNYKSNRLWMKVPR